MTIIVDSREQAPFAFEHDRYGVQIQQGALTVGDYSLAGLTDKVAVEPRSYPTSCNAWAGSVNGLKGNCSEGLPLMLSPW